METVIYNNEILSSYKNGNTEVIILRDGTKIRRIPIDEKPVLEFPEMIDLKISDRCNHNCPFCYTDSKPDGKYVDFSKIPYYIRSIYSGTEVAIGGGSIFENPTTELLLEYLKYRNIVASITVNEKDIRDLECVGKVIDWYSRDLIKGLGISLDPNPLQDKKTSFNYSRLFSVYKIINNKKYRLKSDIVFHAIVGVHNPDDLLDISSDFKLLILGFKKDCGRSKEFFESDKYIEYNYNKIMTHFKVVSFDNLALEQLDIKSKVSEEIWNKYYMGDDGEYSIYIDAVKNYASISSSHISNFRYDIKPDDTINEIFKLISKEDNIYD